MKTFERQMRKVFDKNGKLKEYNISLGVNSQINEDRFYIKQKDKKTKNKKDIIVCDVLICFPDEYVEFQNEHEEFQSQIQSLKNEISEQRKSIESMENQLSSIHSEHQKELERIDDEHSGKIDELNEVIHEKDMEIERTKTKYETDIGNLKEEHQKELNALKIFDEEYHMRIQDHQSEVFDLKEEHQKEFSGIKDQITRETIHHNDNLNSLENGLSLIGYIKGDYKSSLKALKEDIEQFQMIGKYIEMRENEILPDIKMKEDDEDSS